ncbi:GtrA family protein [Massilia sp. W12]|uniref:GtrA family protein n=1 Tax=Massilia sp. W12 TaxID=3126507 RepID=UPI0030CCFD2B
MLNALWQRHRQFLLYCICGGSGVVAHYAVYLLLCLALDKQVANAAGYLAGTLLSFALNRVFTFNLRDRTAQRLAQFLITAGAGYLASALLLGVLVDVLHMDKRFALIPVLPLVVLLQFTLNKRFAFKGASQ